MDAIVENVVRGLNSLALEEFKLLWNAKQDVERMKNTVGAIRATLLDAEEKANNNNHQASLWLARLRDVLYDADDLLDDFSTEALRRNLMTQNKVAKKVRIFFSKSNQLVYNREMAHKLREVRGKLDEIEKDRRQFNFTDQPLKSLSVLEGRKQTCSNVKDDIIGREEETDIILRFLLDSNVKSSVSIIPIVGFGGLGKTSLAQLVYNHEDVQKQFGLKRWVCVSDEFDVGQIGQKILEQASPKEMEQVQKGLRQLIEGKKYLIVLDDVWNEDDVESWRELRSLLATGAAEGSKVIVTTRSEKVGKMMGTHEPIILKGLDDKRSLELFCRMASTESGGSNEKLSAIGKEVAKVCGGVPLAIRASATLVYEKTLEGITDLSYLRNCELWNVDKSLEERIFGVLKLSYDNLPSQMKSCFAFCSLFPKDFPFQKETLIQMWVAEGFIQPTNPMRSEEDVGNEYFMNLLSRSFFQDAERDIYDNIVTCKMHDIIHDLALHVTAKTEYVVIRGEKHQREATNKNTTRHLSCYDVLPTERKVRTSFLKCEKSRTMLLLPQSIYMMPYPIFDSVASKLRCLRVLNVSRSYIERIPKSIGKLKHLRFLDLSHNFSSLLPNAICKLHNLQTLNLDYVPLEELPRDISKLVSLRHLHLTPYMWLEWMPSGLGQLTRLQTLRDFAVADQKMQGKRRSARINELGGLNNLRGTLRITGLRHLRLNPEEAESARLKEKQYLQQLSLVWDRPRLFVYPPLPKVDSDEKILDGLCPHETMKGLHIQRFCGERLPDWFGNLRELQHLMLWDCQHLISLPEGLHNLTSLRTLTIEGCPLLADDERQKFAHIPRMDQRSVSECGM